MQNNKYDEVQANLYAASANTFLKNYNEADKFYVKAIELHTEIGNKSGVLEAKLLRAQMNQYQGNYDEASNIYREIEPEIKANESSWLNLLNLSILAEIEFVKKNFEKAYNYEMKHKEISDSLKDIETAQRIEFFKVLFETEQKNNQIHQLSLENKLKTESIKRNRLLVYGLIVLILFVLLLSLILFQNFKK